MYSWDRLLERANMFAEKNEDVAELAELVEDVIRELRDELRYINEVLDKR